MRSLKYAAAVLPFLSGVLADKKNNGNDETVVVTRTKTITYCPITIWDTECNAIPTLNHDTHWGTWGGPNTTASVTSGSVTSTRSGTTGTASTTSFSNNGNGTTSSHSITSTRSGNQTTTSFISSSTTASQNATTCSNSTSFKTFEPDTQCNRPENRGRWCSGKNVDDDTHIEYKTGKTKSFTLLITSGTQNFDGTGNQQRFLINGESPGAPIEANWGDMVQVTVINGLTDNATTIHWHGIRQIGTNDQDGVPGVTECPIAPGASRTYTWLASTYGTGWYHSHTLSQYGGGLRGPVIIHGPATANYDHDMGSVMIDDTYNSTIFQMAYNIARTQGAPPAAENYLLNGKNRNPRTGTGEAQRWTVKSGKKHLFRIINSSAQTGYMVRFDSHKMTVISSDFTPIKPYETEWLRIISGQRYNVIVEMNQPSGAYFLRAVSQNGCASRTLNSGLLQANGIFTYDGNCATNPIVSNTTITVDVSKCRDEPLASLIPHVSKTGGSESDFRTTVKLMAGGNAGGAAFSLKADGTPNIISKWFLGGVTDGIASNSATTLGTKTINVTYDQPTLQNLGTLQNVAYNSTIYGNSYVLNGAAGSWAYFVIQNNFRIAHPMHLHGHDFSVLGQGEGVFGEANIGQLNFANPARRDTALLYGAPVAGSQTAFTSGWTVIGFETDNPGAWLMHCHIVWHADGGMGIQYLERPDEIKDKYSKKAEFQNQCSAYKAYEAAGGHRKDAWESGLKKRHLEEHLAHGQHGVVRNSF